MRGITSVFTLVLLGTITIASQAFAQNSDHTWSKTYPVTGRPTLSVETGDADLEIRSCGDCHQIRVSVEANGHKLSDYRIEETQTGDHVTFHLKEKSHIGFSFHADWSMHRTVVLIETPAELSLDAKTNDGNVEVTGLHGELQLHSGDGRLTLQNLTGSLLLKSGDGNVHLVNFNGNLDATVSDGGITADGVFTGLSVHSSDGSVDLTARANSQTSKPWGVKTANGGVVMRRPKIYQPILTYTPATAKSPSHLRSLSRATTLATAPTTPCTAV